MTHLTDKERILDPKDYPLRQLSQGRRTIIQRVRPNNRLGQIQGHEIAQANRRRRQELVPRQRHRRAPLHAGRIPSEENRENDGEGSGEGRDRGLILRRWETIAPRGTLYPHHDGGRWRLKWLFPNVFLILLGWLLTNKNNKPFYPLPIPI